MRLTTKVLDAKRCAAVLQEIAPLFEPGALTPSIISKKLRAWRDPGTRSCPSTPHGPR
ncbi:MAG: hypothetical protein ACM3SW_14170 [Actinomycetota bacterium]